MDPNACLERFMDAEGTYIAHKDVDNSICANIAHDYLEEMKEAHKDLCDWMQNGGFEPDWSKYGFTKEFFVNYFKRTK